MHQITLILTQNNSEVDFVLENSLEKKVQGLHKPLVVKLLQALVRMAQLASVRPSVCEVPSSIPGDVTSLIQPSVLCV